MKPFTRRSFLARSAGAAGLLVTQSCSLGEAPGDSILVNHLGFAPSAAKYCIAAGRTPLDFEVVRQDKVVYRGTMQPAAMDLGEWVVGDFSAVQKEGTFFLRGGAAQSQPFDISSDVYTPAVRKSVGYFAVQRCGESRSGHHAPCHLDDGRRRDNGQHQDVTGGWHDACDVRKWVDATIYGMTGLDRALEMLGKRLSDAAVIEELRWGNQYFLKMQEPAGYLMNYCGGDDGNHYTDNRIGTEDDRLIHTDPCGLPAQFHFISAQARLVRRIGKSQPQYADRCAAAARRCFLWCRTRPDDSTSLAAAVIAAVEMSKAFGDQEYADAAAAWCRRLLMLQDTQIGHFKAWPGNEQPAREIMNGNLPMLALCEAIETMPGHPDAASWRKALRLQGDYLLNMAQRSAFGIIPFSLYQGSDPGGGRRMASFWYRYFMPRPADPDGWWVGINSHLASNGVGCARAGGILGDSKLAALAQRQLDWIIGVNPFGASTVTAVGRNHPAHYVTDAFDPPTPPIPGGVYNGIGGDADDQPITDAGEYHTCEYWTPMVAYTMWLMAELQTT